MQLQKSKQQKLFFLCADVDSDSSKFNVVHVALKDSGVVTLARTSGPIQKGREPEHFRKWYVEQTGGNGMRFPKFFVILQ